MVLLRQVVGVIGTQHQEVEEMPKSWWSCLEGITTSSTLAVRTVSLPPRLFWKSSRWLVAVMVVVVLVMLEAAPCCSLEARCPSVVANDSYCQCSKEQVRSGFEVSIKCDFQKQEDVLLTENLYPFREAKALSASVRIANATSVTVRQDFLAVWLKVLSVGLDLWNCGTVNLASAPPVYLRRPHSFSTFVGMSLVGCQVPEVPARLLRDRVTASLRIKNSVVGTVRQGVFDGVSKVRYIVWEDSVVGEVEGSVAAEGYVTLSQLNNHRWNGLVLSNVTVHTLGPGAFNLTHKARERENTHKVVVQDCQVEHVGRGAITAQGDVAVTIKDNRLGRLEDDALIINVTRDFKFEGNVVAAAEEGALRGLDCHTFTKLDKNTIYITTKRNLTDLFQISSFIPFPASCGQSQVFTVVKQALRSTTIAASHSTWVLLGLLLVLLLAAGGVLHWWRENNKLQNLSQNHFHFYNGVASSARYQANREEVNVIQDSVPNPLYDRTAL